MCRSGPAENRARCIAGRNKTRQFFRRIDPLRVGQAEKTRVGDGPGPGSIERGHSAVRIAQETVTEEAGIKKISRNLAGSIDREGNRAVYRSWGIERGDRAVVIPNEAVLVAARIEVST